MNTVLAVGFFTVIFYYLIQFARQEEIEDYYEEAIIDVEGRLDWAHTRTTFPFGMKAQLQVAGELLGTAKQLWQNRQWQKAYLVALKSQEAMDRAQQIYVAGIGKRG